MAQVVLFVGDGRKTSSQSRDIKLIYASNLSHFIELVDIFGGDFIDIVAIAIAHIHCYQSIALAETD